MTHLIGCKFYGYAFCLTDITHKLSRYMWISITKSISSVSTGNIDNMGTSLLDEEVISFEGEIVGKSLNLYVYFREMVVVFCEVK